MYGSHENVCKRIHDFHPVYQARKRKYRQLACYVTSIRKLDHFLKSIYQIARQRQQKTGQTFSIVYFSDHGVIQDTHDGIIHMIHHPGYLQSYQVPLYMVSSNNADAARTIQQPLSPIHFTAGLADWLGITSPELSDDASLFQEGTEERDRPVHNPGALKNDPAINIKDSLLLP